MNWTTIKRIFRAGFLDFWRNGFVSFSSIFMMVFTLFVIGLAIFTGVILDSTLQQFRDKADMNVYFTTDASTEKIATLESSLKTLPEVATVTYISKEDALTNFRALHQNDQLTLQALDELGDNPLGAVLNVKAKNISQYETIASFLKNQEALDTTGSQIIYKINYYDAQHRVALDRLVQYTDAAKKIGIILAILFIFTSVLNSFATLSLAIYTSREEISVMQLVGASGGYIRAPFMVEGVMYGLIAALLTLLLFYPLTWWMGQATEAFFGGINVFHFYLSNFALFFVVMVGSGVLIGAAASFLAVRRYLKI